VVLFFGLLQNVHAATPRTLVAKVERVSDGDTVIATTSNQTKLRIRLLGIDAPEVPNGAKPGQPFGEEARDHLARLIGGRTIQVETYDPDRFKRILAVVFLGSVNVNVEMVQEGLAEVYQGAPCKAYCRDLRVAEIGARRDRVGMWAQGAEYESPRAFRQRLKIRGD
jgi:endonuclease YncB( thermonuclease family)